MHHSIYLLTFSLALFLSTANAIEGKVVKVLSGDCSRPTSSFESTGTVVEIDGKVYVATVARKILAANSPEACHFVRTGDHSAPRKAMLARWRFNGFALLALDDESGLSPIRSTDIGTSARSIQTELTVFGFPHNESRLSTSSGYDVISLHSDRGAFSPLHEIRGPAIDSGYAGSPLMGADGKLEGVVASHFVDLQPGIASIVKFWSTEPETSAHFFIHPSQSFWSLLTDIARDPATPSFQQNPRDQISGINRLKVGRLLVKESCPSRDTRESASRFPIGGVDVVGIGGKHQGQGCYITVQLDSELTNPATPLPEPASAWYRRLVGLLSTNPEAPVNAGQRNLEIPYMIRENPAFGIMERRMISSLEEAIHLMESSDPEIASEPLVLAYTHSLDFPGTDPHLAPIRKLARKLEADVVGLYFHHQTTTSEELKLLLRELYFVTVIVQSEDWQRLPLSTIDRLLDTKVFSVSWKILSYPFTGGQKTLHAEFMALREGLNPLKPSHPKDRN